MEINKVGINNVYPNNQVKPAKEVEEAAKEQPVNKVEESKEPMSQDPMKGNKINIVV